MFELSKALTATEEVTGDDEFEVSMVNSTISVEIFSDPRTLSFENVTDSSEFKVLVIDIGDEELAFILYTVLLELVVVYVVIF